MLPLSLSTLTTSPLQILALALLFSTTISALPEPKKTGGKAKTSHVKQIPATIANPSKQTPVLVPTVSPQSVVGRDIAERQVVDYVTQVQVVTVVAGGPAAPVQTAAVA